MILNFILDNAMTFRDRRLHGWKLVAGLAVFSLACSIGLIVNISLARFLLTLGVSWYLAGVAGLAVGAVWNYATNLALTWRGHAIR